MKFLFKYELTKYLYIKLKGNFKDRSDMLHVSPFLLRQSLFRVTLFPCLDLRRFYNAVVIPCVVNIYGK